MDSQEELLDLFNEHEEVIGIVGRHEYYKNRAKFPGYLRSAEVFIRNDKGQLWVPRRTAARSIAPSSLDYSAGGHVSSGETYMTGCLREMEEELNLKLSEADLKFVHKFTPVEGAAWFRSLYLYKTNEAPDYNRDDFSEYYWLTPKELIAKLEAGEPAKQSMLLTVSTLIHEL